ncbi:hypothetical protein C0J52_09695 [Blattella germanica]|nr:hypothetical protein C0J52_09695 [Blattella germanica]
MGQGTSRLNWVCSCEDGKFNLSATYEEQKPSPSETPVTDNEESKKPQSKTEDNTTHISTAKDILLPIMDVESRVDESSAGTRLRRTYSSCDLVYTKPAPDSKRGHGNNTGKSTVANHKNGQQYRSHEVLSSAGSSSTNTESSGLSQSNSENSLNSTKSADSKLHRLFATSINKIKREQNDYSNKQRPNNGPSGIPQPTPERKLSINSTTSTGSTDRKSSIGDISSLSEILKKKKKEARRAEVVAAVTKRLYSTRKKVEAKPEPVEVVPEQEDKPEDDDGELEELKLCARARTRLQELSKRALHAHRTKAKRFSDVEAQTDFDTHVQRVKEVSVSTEEYYNPPSMFFLENRNFLLSNYAYPSMRQIPPWSAVSVRNQNCLPQEDNFSDDSLDSNHELNPAEDEKPSVWDVIKISSGKQFTTNEESSSDQSPQNASTQTLIHLDDEETIASIVSLDEDHTSKTNYSDFCYHNSDDSIHEDCEKDDINSANETLSNDVDAPEQGESCCCTDESQENDSCIRIEKASLQKIDRHLYTITENSELSDSADLSPSDFDNSCFINSSQKPVTVIEKNDNVINEKFPSEDVCSCKCCSTHTCDTSVPFPNSIPCINKSCYCECIHYKTQNPDLLTYKDSTTQTTKEITLKFQKINNIDTQDKSTITTTDTGSNTDISQQPRNINEPIGKVCKICNKLQKNQYNINTRIKCPNTKTEGIQCSLNILPANISTQTNNTQVPNLTILCSSLLGTFHQLLQLSNPRLQFEDCIGVFFNGQTSQPIIMKPIHWNRDQASDTIGIQTEDNVGQRQFDGREKYTGTVSRRHQQKRRNKYSPENEIYEPQTAHSSLNRDVEVTLPHPEDFQTNIQNAKSSTSDPWEQENFSDDDEGPSLPRTAVGVVEETEACGYRHWTEIKNLILGRNRNIFPYNITVDDQYQSDRPSKRIKKKSVSWSDLSGCGALHTEMIFTSDHNLFDSNQVPHSKINKSSLLDIIATRSPGLSHRRQIMTTSQLEKYRRQNGKYQRRWSLADINELSNKQIEGKLQLSAFLNEASALVSSLSQATRLLEKGRQLDIKTSAIHREPNMFNSIHNELWLSEASSLPNHIPTIETEIKYSGPSSFPAVTCRSEYDYDKPRRKNIFREWKNDQSRSKDCNLDKQTKLNQWKWNKVKPNCLCEQQDVFTTTSLPDCSTLSRNHWCSGYSIPVCPIHCSESNISHIFENDSLLRSYPSYLHSSLSLSSPRAYRQHLIEIRKQVIKASLPFISNK